MGEEKAKSIIEAMKEALKTIGTPPKKQYLYIGWLDYPKVFEIFRGQDNEHLIKDNIPGYIGRCIPGALEVRIDYEKPFGFELKDEELLREEWDLKLDIPELGKMDDNMALRYIMDIKLGLT